MRETDLKREGNAEGAAVRQNPQDDRSEPSAAMLRVAAALAYGPCGVGELARLVKTDKDTIRNLLADRRLGPEIVRLSGKKSEAAVLLAGGMSITDVAKGLDINRSTIHRWLKNNAFVKEVNQLRTARVLQQAAQIDPLVPVALETLEQVMRKATSERARVAAATAILRLALKPLNAMHTKTEDAA